jgi:DNA polymerase-3 subunit gamma/tau
MCKVEYDTSKEVLLTRINKLESMIKEGNIQVKSSNEEKIKDNSAINNRKTSALKNKEKKADELAVEINTDSNVTIDDVKKSWRDILEVFKARRLMVLYASLVTGKIESCINGIVEIKYDQQYAFNIGRLQKDDNRKIIEDIFSEALKERVRIKYTVDKNNENEKTPEQILKETFGEDLVEIIDE